MKQKIQISIPEPCKEGWQNMTPVEKGRFCASCQKTVLDFTYLSDNEIINLVSKNDTLCGRINVSQLNRNLIATQRTSSYFGYLTTTVLAFLGLGTSTVVAQEKPIVEQTDLKYLNKVSDSVKKITVSGVVTDSLGKPFPGAFINIQYSEKSTESDEFGKYSISANLNDVLQFIYLGYETKKVTISSNEINVQMSNANVLIEGGFLIVKKRTYVGRKIRKIKSWFR